MSNILPTRVLEELGFKRKKCKICGRYFWTLDDKREICADHDRYSFINNPIGKKLSYKDIWVDFSKFLEKRGYKPLKRYPVVARWRDDLEFVIASIADFQPWVTKGIIEPPAKKLTIPQFCLRFNDVGNVGFTGRHYTGFVMIGQHAFVKPEEYDTEEYFKDLLDWFLHLDIPIEEFTFHEDRWEGGGNAGYSIEFFLRGLEVANQVYMTFEEKNGQWIEMEKIKVLDMGMGQERVAWILNGTPTSYDIVFPKTLEFLKNNMKIDVDWDIVTKIAPYMSSYDFEEKSLKEFIKELNNLLGFDVSRVVNIMGAMYSIPDHARTLLIAISDGALPSNIGGGYNLRVVLRRMYSFIEKYFDIDIKELFEKIIEDWYEPWLKEDLDEVIDIVNYEIEKYKETRRRAKKILGKIDIKSIDSKKLFDLYQSHGITIELIQDIYPDFEPPRDFYKYLEEHRKKSKKVKTKKDIELDVSMFPETKKEFYEDWKKYYTISTYLGSINDFLVFDKTIFYPLKGGQKYDVGWIFNLDLLQKFSEKVLDKVEFPEYVKNLIKEYLTGNDLEGFNIAYTEVLEVYDVNNVIVHKVNKVPKWRENSRVLLIIDKERRYQISRNHTATHILTGVLRKLYGKHVWQAGAEKDEYKARLDVTHHKLPTKEEIRRIEREVNKVILSMIPIEKFYMRRDKAEEKYGFRIYQGGFIPEVNLRLVKIGDLDIEACSGTHLNNTIEVGMFKILNVERVADGMIRFEFTTGNRAIEYIHREEEIIEKLEKITSTNREHIVKVVEKALKEKEEYSRKLNKILEELITKSIQNGRLYMEFENVSIKDIIPFVMRHQKEINELEIRTKDGILTTKEIEDGRKIGKFYLKLY